METGIFSPPAPLPPPATPSGAGGTGGFAASSLTRETSNVQIRHVEGVRLDELAARLDRVAHEDREDLVGLDGVLDAHLQEAARGGVHRRLPERLGVHLAEALVPVDREPLLGAREDG